MLNRWQSTIVDERGNVQPLANLTVRNEADQSLAKMWASPGTAQPLPDGMVQADGNGYAYFYAPAGLYRIQSNELSIDWRHVDVGAAVATMIAQQALDNALPTYETLAEMQADTSQPVDTMARVVDDPSEGTNGFYLWDGAAWNRTSLQPASAEGVDAALAAADEAKQSAIEAENSAIDAANSADSVQIKEQEREQIFEVAQEERENRFNDFIASSGYQFLGDYAAGIEITEYNQILRDADGEFWRLSGQVELPYTTTGDGLPESDALTPLGDAVLRQDLNDPSQGASLVRFSPSLPGTVSRSMGAKARDTVSVLDFGVVGDGVADDTLALQAAFDACAAVGSGISTPFLTSPGGVICRVTSTVQFTGSGDLSSMIITAGGSSVSPVLRYGSTDNILTFTKNIKLPEVLNTTKPTNGWGSAGIGIELANCNQCEIHVKSVRSFGTGLRAGGYTNGFVYNTVYLQLLDSNKVNLHLGSIGATGWANENLFIGGRFSASSNATTDWAGTRQILIAPSNEATYRGANNNVFLRPSLESNDVEYMVDITGSHTGFISGRYEGSAKRVRIFSETTNGSRDNYFFHGFQVGSLEFTYEGANSSGTSQISGASEKVGSNRIVAYSAGDGISTPHYQGFRPGHNATDKNNSSVDWTYRMYAHGLSGKREDDEFTRIDVDFYSGRLRLGGGVGGNKYFGSTSIDLIHVYGAALGSYPGGTYSLGTAGGRWSEVFAETGAINTSDARSKQQVRTVFEKESAVAMKIKGLIRAFKFNNAVSKKGDGARIHFGVVAQDVAAAFESEGLDPAEYAMFCYDEWDEIPEEVSDDGKKVQEFVPAGNSYGIRYEELLAFVISAL